MERGIILSIMNISVKDEGFYTCRLNVIFNNTIYNVSRTWRVHVSGKYIPFVIRMVVPLPLFYDQHVTFIAFKNLPDSKANYLSVLHFFLAPESESFVPETVTSNNLNAFTCKY